MDTYLPISDAAKIAKLSEDVLHQLVTSGKIRASMLAKTGVIILNESDVRSQMPRDEQEAYKRFEHLANVGIGIREAAKKYNLSHPTISRWVDKGYIRVLGVDGRKTLVSEADVAYCAYVYSKNRGQGKRVFQDNGTPYSKKN